MSAIKHFNDAQGPRGDYDPSKPDGRRSPYSPINSRDAYKNYEGTPGSGNPWWKYSIGDLLGYTNDYRMRGGGPNVSPIMLRIEKILIDGSRDPQATGRAVVDSLRREMTYAGSQAPAPNL